MYINVFFVTIQPASGQNLLQKFSVDLLTFTREILKGKFIVYAVTAQKMKLSIKDFFSKCDQIPRKLRIWSHLLKKSLTENFIFCVVSVTMLQVLARKCLISYRFRKVNWSQKNQHFVNIFHE